MKFEKFVKSLGANGFVYKRGSEERWLASPTVFMRIPDTTRGVMASDILDMPEPINDIINYNTANDLCELFKAVMPYAGCGIKDCIRIFATENNIHQIAIRNNDFALIEKVDIVEIHSRYNNETEEYESKALVISRYPAVISDDPEIIGIVFPKEYEEM